MDITEFEKIEGLRNLPLHSPANTQAYEAWTPGAGAAPAPAAE